MNVLELFQGAVDASRKLLQVDESQIDGVLRCLAEVTMERCDEILAANRVDLSVMDESNPLYDRLLLNRDRVESIAHDLLTVAALSSPIGEELAHNVRPNGMVIYKVRVPFGVIGVIYEARPNVSFDLFGLCFKSSNACLLKGGRDAYNTNVTIVNIIHSVLREFDIDQRVVTLLPPDREVTQQLMEAVGYVDLLIPRGGAGLIKFVRDHAKVPVIETGAGVCHTYVDKDADVVKAIDIIFNAKTRRVSVCNSLDCIVLHRDRLGDLVDIVAALSAKEVEIYADPDAYLCLNGCYPGHLLKRAEDDSFGREFLDYKLAVKCVDDIEQAIDHLTQYSSKHSECIVTECDRAARLFTQMVDASCVYVNVSTAFTDGGQFGFGAEVGISTQKMHARGPMALPELTSYKYIIVGDGQVRS